MKLSKLTIILSILLLFTTACSKEGKNASMQEENQNPQYKWQALIDKYPDAFIEKQEFMDKIRERAVKEEDSYEKSNQEWNYFIERIYDKNGNKIYEIKHVDKIYEERISGSKGGNTYKKRMWPKERGYLYDENGKLIEEIEMGENFGVFTYEVKDKNEKPKSIYKNEMYPNLAQVVKYEYDNNGKIAKETAVKSANDEYKKTEKEYTVGKLKREKITEDRDVKSMPQVSKIYVEIEKEYDETGKMTKKYVLRKNKHNAMRSETNFDMIKGEIVTRYYDGEKVFATVTETLVGEDKEIVKRERDGDEFVIWDEFLQNNKFNKYIVYQKTNKLKFAFINAKAEFEWKYNDSETGIDKVSFNREHFYNDISSRNDYSTQVSLSGEIYEFGYNNRNELEKICLINYKDNIEFPREIMYKRFANEVVDEKFIENIKKYINKKNISIKEKEIENKYKKLLEETNNGN